MNLGEGISRHLFAGAVEADNAAFGIEHHDQSAHGIENGRGDIALFLQRLFGSLQVADVEADAVDEPGLAVLLADHLGFAMEPDDAAIAGEYAVRGTERVSGKKHFRSFGAPALLVF